MDASTDIANDPPRLPFARLMRPMIVAGVTSGILSAIPVFNLMNLAFGCLNVGSIALGLQMHVRANEDDLLTTREVLAFGAVAGSIGGLIASVSDMLVTWAIGQGGDGISSFVPQRIVREVASRLSLVYLVVPLDIILFAVSGALGGMLCLHLFFRSYLR